MTDQLDDWEGRLAAMASGVRYKAPSARKVRPTPLPAARKVSMGRTDGDDPQTFLDERCPCDECELRKQCAAGQLACERFALFMQGQPPDRWREVPTTPTRERFDAL
jgi:hypothetical protein